MASTSSIIRKSYPSQSEESDADFKVPLTPISRMTSYSAPTNPLPPIPKAYTNFGMAGTTGVIVSILLYLLDAFTDVVLLWSLWNQIENSNFYNVSQIWEQRFYVTLGIILIPTILINLISIILYSRMKKRSEGQQVVFNEGRIKRAICIILHLFLLGTLVRYLDLLKCGRNLLRGRRRGPPQSSKRSRTSLQEVSYDEEDIAQDMLYVKSVSKDTNLLDILFNHLKNSSQLVYQIFLIYRSRIVFNTDVLQWKITVGIQLIKVVVCLSSVTWSHVNFQEEVRRRNLEMKQLRCGAISLCNGWRACMIGSRVLALGSFSALRATPDGGLIKVDSYGDARDLAISFPMMTCIFMAIHWLLMIIWIHSQRSIWCTRKNSTKRHECCEFLYTLAMAWVHIFCYVNMQETLTRKRMAFYYILIFIESTALMVLCYFQLISEDIWLRVTVMLLVEFLFIVGLSCSIGYYAFLHPNENRRNSLAA